MAINQVIYDGRVLLDLTNDTVDAAHLAKDYIAHDKSGAQIVGTMESGGITPTGTIQLTDTELTDVTQYANAQVVDANLTAENIKNGVSILGILGTFDFPSDVKMAIAQNGVRTSRTVTTSSTSGSSTISNTVSIDISADDIEVIACFYDVISKREQNTTTVANTPWYNNTYVYPLDSTASAIKTTSYTKTHPSEGKTRVSRTISHSYSWSKPSSGTQYMKFKGTHTMILIYRVISAEE